MALQAHQIQLTEHLEQQSDSEDDDTSTDGSETDDTSTEGSEPERPASTIPQPMVRKTNNNKVGENALMICAPLGEKDLWGHVQVVEIEGNTLEKGAQMYSYRNDANGLALAREDLKARMLLRREQLLWEKENGVGDFAAPSKSKASGARNGN